MKSPRRIPLVALLAALALLLVAAGSAGAASHQPKKPIRPPAAVKVGRVEITRTPAGHLALLVAVRYPIQAADREMRLVARITTKPGAVPLADAVAHRLSSGPPRRPERRRAFTFVHEIDLKPRIAGGLEAAWAAGSRPTVTVEAQGGIDIDGDGKADIESPGIPRRTLPLLPPGQGARGSARRSSAARAGGGTKPFCGSFSTLRFHPGNQRKVPLPACDRSVHWALTAGASGGTAHLGAASLNYTAPKTPGTQTIQLNHGTVVVKVVNPWLRIGSFATPAPPLGPVVRAMGDSVTAGFGYYSTGSSMGIGSLYECKPVGQVLDDACSSNSTATKSGLHEVPYAPDYGLANNISWAAQWANQYSVTNYKNFAISGSEPTNWAPGGDDYATTKQIEAENPDYILMTIGANPILANTLFGLGSTACALESDITGGYEECVEEEFEEVHLQRELKSLYTNLVENTHATIYLMQYHLAIPSSAIFYSVTQIAEMGKLMNETIAAVAKEVSPTRLQVVAPPHFNVGVSLEPVYPSSYTCSFFEFGVDGPSVQSTPTQAELKVAHYASFCGGPKGGGEPWVISGDTGIHPSAAGYAQMASQVPPPAPQG